VTYHNRNFVDSGGTLFDNDTIIYPIRIGIRREDLLDEEIQTVTYAFYDYGSNTIIGYVSNWQEVIEKLNVMIENSPIWYHIEALVRLKARINAQK
jgi:hypothetical protein